MDPIREYLQQETRRQFFGRTATGLGSAALASLLGENRLEAGSSSTNIKGSTSADIRHFAPKAKRAIYLFMAGAPPQQDLFDYKPKMKDWFGRNLPDSVRNGQRLTTLTSGQSSLPIAPSTFNFRQHGQSGAWISDLLPNTARMVDEIAIVKSMWTEAINHDPAITYIQTGRQIAGWPSLGAWLSYGLGNENENLPAFVVLNSTWTSKKEAQALYARLWGNGFLPSDHQGVALRSQGDPVLFLNNPKGVDTQTRRLMLDGLKKMNNNQFSREGDPETQARISQYEMAFRMQASVPELTDISTEPQSTFDLYGEESRKPGTFAYNCLLARRMAEKGVRFTQIFHRGWDHHKNINRDLPLQCMDVDRASWALIQDLRQRGLLDDTLVIWGGEFGRTIYSQGYVGNESNYGRDHHPRCFSIWMAGAGIKSGIVHGQTDDFSYNITEDPVHIRSLNATILHLMGINHERFSVKHLGLDASLTGVEDAPLINGILT